LAKVKKLNHFSTQNGLLTNYPIALAMDNKQRLWVGANHGLSVIFFEKNKPVVLQYQSDEGFPEIVSDRIALAAVNDTMWIGTYSGLFSIPTKNLELKPAKIYLEGLRTNTGYQIDFTQKKTTQQIIFSSDVKNIIFYFSSVSLTYPDHAKILCRLIDRDINWVDASRQDSILYNDLTPGKYTFSIKAINHLGLETEESTVSFIIEKPFWQTWWFILLTILATSLLLIQITAYLVKWKEAEKYKKRKAAFTLRVQQLRVQQMRMNPHFISNAIGGVEQLVRRGENETAFDYLRLFYKYLRRVQEMTNNHILVSVEEEAEILKWYIALESLSMGKNLVSHVIIERTNDEDEEIDAIKIPALMVQPLVENALKHGLFHKTTGTRLLNIRFYAKNQFLFVEIEDNGIGRKKASEIVVQTKAHSHLSMATNNIKRMLNLLRQDGKIAELQYEDLYGAQDQPIGTKVTLILPDDLDESQLTDPDDILNET
jgi:two-component sensor histidine kinase